MDLNKMLAKLTQGERVIGASVILLFIFLFLPWFSKGGGSRNGWHYFLFGVIPFFLALIMVAQIVIARFTETKLPEIPITWGQVHVIAGGLAAALILLKLLIGDKVGAFGFHVTLDRSFGLYLSLLAGIGLVVGGVLKMREPEEAAGGTDPAPPPAT